MRVLFAIPKLKSLSGRSRLTLHPHIGIAYLSSFLRKNGVEICVFDDGIENNHEKLLRTIEGFKPDLIGVTIFSYCYRHACDLIKIIKNNCNVPLVLGGVHVNIIKGKILYDTGAEFAIKQEGEYALLELLERLENGSPDLKDIRGLIWRKDSGEVIENADRPLITDLDNLPFPDYEIFDINRYYCYKSKMLPIITSRGCPFQCNFCSVRLSMGQGFRARSAKNVVKEIEHFVEKGWRDFEIDDDCFTFDKDRTEEICDLIIKKNLEIRFQLSVGIRVDKVTPNLLRKMKSAGCYYISYGCETGNDRILKLIKKAITLGQVKKAVEWTNDAGISNSVNFMIGHIGETYKEAMDTIDFAKSLPTNHVNFYNLIPYPGTEIYTWVKQHASFLIDPEYYLENISDEANEPIFETQEFTKEQRKKIITIGRDLFKKKYLSFRFGSFIGIILYYISSIRPIDKLAANFVADNCIGKVIFTFFSGLFQRIAKSNPE